MVAEGRQTIYLSKKDQKLMDQIKKDAEREDRSVSYIVLKILRKHYGMDKGDGQ